MDVRKYVVEFIGTFFFVLTIGCVLIGGAESVGSLAPIAIGSSLMVMVFAGGHISGGHFNPAVTLGVFIRGKCSASDVVPYIIAQVAGASVAALTVAFLVGSGGFGADVVMPALPDSFSGGQVTAALLAEFLYTFALVWVVLNVATATGTGGNSFYGLAIGFTVLIGAFAVGGVSGGAFNPAVAVGITMMKLTATNNIWIYMLGDFAGAILAALAFKFATGPESSD